MKETAYSRSREITTVYVVEMKILIVLLFLNFYVAPAFGSDEYFGVFTSEPSFTLIPSEDRPLFKLSKEFQFIDQNEVDWNVPIGTVVDGASIPKFAWSFVGAPMSGKYLQASIIHDHYCDSMARSAHETHRSFYHGMRAKGVSKPKAKLMYWAVNTFGPTWKIGYKNFSRCVMHSRKNVDGTLVKYPLCKNITEEVKTRVETLDIRELTAEKSQIILNYMELMSNTLEQSNGDVTPTACPQCAIYERDATLDALDEISRRYLEQIELQERF